MVYEVSALDATPFSIDGLLAQRGGSETSRFMTVAQSQGEDLLFWTCIYLGHSAGNARWTMDEARVVGTMLLRVPTKLGRGEDALEPSFVRGGLHVPEYFSPADLAVSQETHISWELGGRAMSWLPGEGWKVEGTHAGVSASLTARPTEEPFWTLGPVAELGKRGAAGYDVATKSDGWLEFNDQRFPIQKGVGTYERLINVEGARDVLGELSSPTFAGDCFDGDLHVYFQRGGRHKAPYCRIIADEMKYEFTSDAADARQSLVSLYPSEWWIDPTSGLRLPVAWRLAAESHEAALHLVIRARTRGYWNYLWRTGVVAMVWFLGRASGEFRNGTSATRPIDSALVASRWARTIQARYEEGERPEAK